ncbi:MAG: ankyrin repeat domain-containing protein [Bacteroidota bacterium]
MKTADITNPLFLQAVNALDVGNIDELQKLVTDHPRLVKERLKTPGEEGYFKDPYLLWFIADNPIRNFKLPPNIVAVTGFLIDAVKQEAPETYLQQIEYALGLVVTGRIPRECGVQIALMDLLIDAGATPGSGVGAVAHGNMEAANHLIERGGKLTLPVAICLNRMADINRLLSAANASERLLALTASAFYGKVDMIRHLLDMGVNPNGYPNNGTGFHSHATPLHQAVYSGSLDAVKLLVAAGARLDMTDKVYNGTPLGWAIYMQTETDNEVLRANYAVIEKYLRAI